MRQRPQSRAAGTASAPRHGGAGEVRIIGGRWRSVRLPVPDLPGLRPTPDRVRETLFNWLGQTLDGWRCVDAFAGSGALGLEAASRGAAQVLMAESHAALIARLRENVQRLQAANVTVHAGDGVALLLRQPPQSLDLVFLDPPFDSSVYPQALKAAVHALGLNGFVYLEAAQAWDDAALQEYGLRVYRQMHAGNVFAHLLQRAAQS